MPSGTFWIVKLLDDCEVGIDWYSIGHVHMRAFELRDILKYPDIAFLGDLQNRKLTVTIFYPPRKTPKKVEQVKTSIIGLK